jgi:hypothetical protein
MVSGTDVGSGIAGFDVYVSTNHGPWSLWLAGITNSSAVFTGQLGSNYGFFSLAHDWAGNSESMKNVADTTTTVSNPSTPLFNSVSQKDGLVTLSWTALAGRDYQLQARPDLASGTWSNLGAPLTATNSTLSASDPSNSAAAKFYRVILLP